MSERTLPTLIAKLEEALKAATAGPWIATECLDVWVEQEHPDLEGASVAQCGDASWPDADVKEEEWKANARLIVLMRNSLPTLIEALKRQGEALSHIVSIGEAHGSNYDFERILDMRDIARAALTAHKEKSDV